MKISINCCHRSDCQDTHCPGRPDGGNFFPQQEQAGSRNALIEVCVMILCAIGGLSSGWLLAMALDAAGLR